VGQGHLQSSRKVQGGLGLGYVRQALWLYNHNAKALGLLTAAVPHSPVPVQGLAQPSQLSPIRCHPD
jgi:hypothetical protein